MDRNKYCEIQISLEPVQISECKSINLEYYLLKQNYEDGEHNHKLNTYGIEIVKKENITGQIVNVEKKVAPHLSVNKSKVEEIIKILSKNTVTPMGLFSVLDNLIGVCC